MRRATSGTNATASGDRAGSPGTRSVRAGGGVPAHEILERRRPIGDVTRAALALSLALLATGVSPAARADDVDTCASASERGQDLRDRGQLRAARALFVACAAAQCPAVVRKDCADWLAAVDEKLPTIAIHARDADGHDLAEVRVTVDGEVLTERLDGRALAMDPGTHTFRFAAPKSPEITQTLMLREGEKSRLVDVTFVRPAAPAARERAFSVPAVAWVLGGVSLAGFGALAGFGVSAKSAVDDMRATCAPGCTAERVDAARRDMILANVGLGVGIAALGTAVLVVVLHDTGPAPASTATALQLRAGAGPLGLSLTGVW